MEKGVGFFGFFQILFGGGSLFYGIGTLSYFFLTNPALNNLETLPESITEFLSDPFFAFFTMPYLAPYFFLTGAIAVVFGLLTFVIGYRLNKETKFYTGVVSAEQSKWGNGLMVSFLIFMVLMTVAYLAHGITLQLGGL